MATLRKDYDIVDRFQTAAASFEVVIRLMNAALAHDEQDAIQELMYHTSRNAVEEAVRRNCLPRPTEGDYAVLHRSLDEVLPALSRSRLSGRSTDDWLAVDNLWRRALVSLDSRYMSFAGEPIRDIIIHSNHNRESLARSFTRAAMETINIIYTPPETSQPLQRDQRRRNFPIGDGETTLMLATRPQRLFNAFEQWQCRLSRYISTIRDRTLGEMVHTAKAAHESLSQVLELARSSYDPTQTVEQASRATQTVEQVTRACKNADDCIRKLEAAARFDRRTKEILHDIDHDFGFARRVLGNLEIRPRGIASRFMMVVGADGMVYSSVQPYL